MDWTPYFVYAISAVANGESFDQDWTAGYADGSVKLTELNTAIAAPGTEEALEKAEADLAGGLHVFAGPLSGHRPRILTAKCGASVRASSSPNPT